MKEEDGKNNDSEQQKKLTTPHAEATETRTAAECVVGSIGSDQINNLPLAWLFRAAKINETNEEKVDSERQK
jgi:hypothetical protein